MSWGIAPSNWSLWLFSVGEGLTPDFCWVQIEERLMHGHLKLRRGLCALGVPKELPQEDLWGKPEMNCIPMPAASFLQLAGLWKGAKLGVAK